jgi:hypothetical protein
MQTGRRSFLKSSAGALLLAGLRARQTQAADLTYNPKQTFKLLAGDTVPPDQVRQMGAYLEAVSVSEGALPASGGWTALYDMVELEVFNRPRPGRPMMVNSVYGRVALTKPSAVPEYRCRMVCTPTNAIETVDAQVRCEDDALASLRDYNLSWECRAPGTPAVDYVRRESGRVGAGTWSVVSTGGTEKRSINSRLTARWLLFDRVRHLSATDGWRESFDMLDDFSSLRRNQMLRFCGRATLEVGGCPLPLRFYEQLGEGILPTHYAVDDQNRTLFVTQAHLGWALAGVEGSAS